MKTTTMTFPPTNTITATTTTSFNQFVLVMVIPLPPHTLTADFAEKLLKPPKLNSISTNPRVTKPSISQEDEATNIIILKLRLRMSSL